MSQSSQRSIRSVDQQVGFRRPLRSNNAPYNNWRPRRPNKKLRRPLPVHVIQPTCPGEFLASWCMTTREQRLVTLNFKCLVDVYDQEQINDMGASSQVMEYEQTDNQQVELVNHLSGNLLPL